MKNSLISTKKNRLTHLVSRLILPKKCPKYPRADVVIELCDVDRTDKHDGLSKNNRLVAIENAVSRLGLKYCVLLKPMDYSWVSDDNAYPAFSLIGEAWSLIASGLGKIAPNQHMRRFVSSSAYILTLRVIDPKVVFSIQPMNELIGACWNLNIKVVDVLHGYGVYEHHWRYGRKSFGSNILADYYLALDRRSESLLKTYSMVPTVNDKIKHVKPVIMSVDFEGASYHGSKMQSSSRALVSLQARPDVIQADREYDIADIHPQIVEIIKSKEFRKTEFLIKPHPIHLSNPLYLAKLDCVINQFKNCKLVLDHDFRFYALKSDWHLTGASTAIRQAALLGLKSVAVALNFLELTRGQFLDAELDADVVFCSVDRSCGEIRDWIRNPITSAQWERYRDLVAPRFELASDSVVDHIIMDCK